MTDPQEPTDQQLWTRALAGDEAGFERIYDRYASRLLSYAYRRTAAPAVAEDLVSTVMFETWRRRTAVRFADDGSMAGWLFTTARYVLANLERSRRRHRVALERSRRLAGGSTSEDPGQRLLDGERLRAVLSVLDCLPRPDRDLLALVAWSGLEQSEIAIALGIPVGTLKSRLSRARRRLEQLTATSDSYPAAERPARRAAAHARGAAHAGAATAHAGAATHASGSAARSPRLDASLANESLTPEVLP